MINKFKVHPSASLRARNSKFKIIFLISLLTLHFTLLTSTAIAVESTPSADIKTKLEELKKEIASKAAKLKQGVISKLKNKAYVGKVTSKSDVSLILATEKGPKIVSINQDTVFESKIKSKQKFSQKTVSPGDNIAALGDADEINVLTAKKIILLAGSEADEQPKEYLWGQIISISDKLITLRDRDFKNIAVTLPFSDVKLNDFVILTGLYDKNDIFKAEFVYVYPQNGIIKPKKIATPSASLRLNPSATLKSSPSAKISSPSAKPKTKKSDF